MTPGAPRRIGVIGGTGFVGRVLCRRLRADGHRLVVVTRQARRHADLDDGDSLRLLEGNASDAHFLEHAFTGCDTAINLAGILNERGNSGREFRAVHVELPRVLGRVAKGLGVRRVLHMSALGARAGGAPSRYLRSKGEGGNALQVELGGAVGWTIFRPSVIFGPGDDFTRRFARLLRLAPGVFPLACPDARFAPVYVEDVAEAFARSLDNDRVDRQRLALCGPEEYSLREVVALVGDITGRPRRILPLSDQMAKLQATIMEHFPGKPFSRDNYLSLQIDSVCESGSGDREGFAELGIRPQAMPGLMRSYLDNRDQN